MSDQADLIPIAEAAARIGVHKNTVHARLAAGWYRWEWMPATRGRQKGVFTADLDNDRPMDASNGSIQTPLDASITRPTDPSTRLDAQAAQQTLPALVNQTLAPIIAQLAAVAEENGRLKEENRQLRAQLEERQAETLPADMSPPPERPPWWRRILRGP